MACPSNGRWTIDRGTAGLSVKGRTSRGAYLATTIRSDDSMHVDPITDCISAISCRNLWGYLRPSTQYQPTPTSRPPSRVTSFPSLSATTAPPSSLPRSRTIPRGPGPLLSRRPRRLTTVEKTRYPRFLDDPCVHAPLFDPGGPPVPSLYRTGDVVFRTLINVDSAFAPFEARSRGLHALCVRFAAGVARTTQHDSGWWPALTGQDSHLLGRIDGLPSCLSVYMASSGRALARTPVGGGFPASPFRLRGGFTVPP